MIDLVAMFRSVQYSAVFLGLLCLVAATGCASGKNTSWRFAKSLDVRRAIGLKKDTEEVGQPEMPTRLVSTWQDATLNRAGQKPHRGFGGRILFFKNDSKVPVRVDGQLVVYAYDETNRADHETHPTRRFVFPAEQFVRHESECQLGPSYSVWLPWDELGGEQKNISLITRFEPKGGPLVVGDQTRHLLPGTRQMAKGKESAPAKPVGEIQLTEFTETSKVSPPPKSTTKEQRQVTSISLSRAAWKQRLAMARENTVQSDAATGSADSAQSSTDSQHDGRPE